MIFDASVYTSFVKACRDYGITVPIIPGIMCISNFGGFARMTKFCKSRVPEEMVTTLEAAKDDKEMFREASVALGTKLCQGLQAGGAPGLHFYTLNLEKVTLGILSALGLNKVPE
jgi:methylenetetrahydrofolate reductase (NADPH)